MHEHTLVAYATMCVDAPPRKGEDVHIYVDGSGGSGDGCAAWTFVCFEPCAGGSFYMLGYACGPVVDDPGGDYF